MQYQDIQLGSSFVDSQDPDFITEIVSKSESILVAYRYHKDNPQQRSECYISTDGFLKKVVEGLWTETTIEQKVKAGKWIVRAIKFLISALKKKR